MGTPIAGEKGRSLETGLVAAGWARVVDTTGAWFGDACVVAYVNSGGIRSNP